MKKDFDAEKLNELAAVISEDEIDQFFGEDIVGAGKPNITIQPITVTVTLRFDWCPTSGCTYSCRL